MRIADKYWHAAPRGLRGDHTWRGFGHACGALLAISPTVLIWSLPLTAGYLLAVPFGVLTAHPAVGHAFQKAGLCGIPEDFDPPPEVQAVQRLA